MLIIAMVLLAFTDVSAEAKKQSDKVEMPQWEEVNELLPKYSKFTVMDLETGLQFRVQRRAGSNHADVQPLTSKDTAIMKAIYNGKWSWKRRAIIVISENGKIAASMHGMPHGGGALKNDFPGHFCIHFFGSTTHRTNFMDLSHKLMILKSAGKLEKYLEQTDPYDLVNAYIAGIKQQDPYIVSFISLQDLEWKKLLPRIENVNINRMEVLPAEDVGDQLTLTIPVEINWQIKGRGGRNFTGEILLVRFLGNEQWKVDSIRFLEDNKITIPK
ncbi:YkuD domain-containing protein [Mesobacillus thioparans]